MPTASYAYVVREESDSSGRVISVHESLKGAQASGSEAADNFNVSMHPGIPVAKSKWAKSTEVKNRWEREVVTGTIVSIERHKITE